MTTRTRKKIDPFATEPETTETENETKETETVANETVTVTGGAEVTVTLKAGTGFDAPWIVLRAPDLATAKELLEGESDLLKSVMERTAQAGVFFASQMPSGAAKGGDGASAPTGGRPARQEAPSGQSRDCKHGQMVYRSGSKNGRTWEAFFCPTPQGTPDQCKPNFL